MPDPQHMQRVTLGEVTDLIPPDDEAPHLTGCELLEAQADAGPSRSVASRHSQGLPAGQAVRPLLDPLVRDARCGIGLRERFQRQPVAFLFLLDRGGQDAGVGGGNGTAPSTQRHQRRLRRFVQHLQQRLGGAGRAALALLPVAESVQRYINPFGELGLTEAKPPPHPTHIPGRVAPRLRVILGDLLRDLLLGGRVDARPIDVAARLRDVDLLAYDWHGT